MHISKDLKVRKFTPENEQWLGHGGRGGFGRGRSYTNHFNNEDKGH